MTTAFGTRKYQTCTYLMQDKMALEYMVLVKRMRLPDTWRDGCAHAYVDKRQGVTHSNPPALNVLAFSSKSSCVILIYTSLLQANTHKYCQEYCTRVYETTQSMPLILRNFVSWSEIISFARKCFTDFETRLDSM